MTITVEMNFWNWGWICLGIVYLAIAGLGELGVLRPALRIGRSPLATALLGALALVYPLMSAITVQLAPWGFFIGLSLWVALLVVAARIEYRAKQGLSHAESPQSAVDPGSASTAPEARLSVDR